MAQYPFRVSFADETAVYSYLVRANDRWKAVSRAKRKHLEEHGQAAPTGPEGEPSRILNLTPLQRNSEFFARIDGKVVAKEPCATPQQAVEAALEFLRNRTVRP